MKGLSTSRAKDLLQEKGPNLIPGYKITTACQLFYRQVKEPMILLLLLAFLLSLVLKEYGNAWVILFVAVLNTLTGFLQEYKAEQSMQLLRKMDMPVSWVYRDGVPKQLPTEQLVPGDWVLLKEGDRVPADLELREANQLKVDESQLTGESLVVIKELHSHQPQVVQPLYPSHCLYKGSLLVTGHGIGQVTATGLNTELGKIARLMEQPSPPTPLQKKLASLGKKLGWAVLVLATLFFLTGMLRGGSWPELFMTALSLFVAAIPEGLPAFVTIALAIGALKLARQQVLVRKMAAVESLGAVTHICTDKTGTLTLNQLKVVEIAGEGFVFTLEQGWQGDHPRKTRQLLQAMYLNHSLHWDESGQKTVIHWRWHCTIFLQLTSNTGKK